MKEIKLYNQTCLVLELVRAGFELAVGSRCRTTELTIEVSGNIGNWGGAAIHIMGLRGFVYRSQLRGGGRHKADLFSADIEMINLRKGWCVRQFKLCFAGERFDIFCEYSYRTSYGQANFPSHITFLDTSKELSEWKTLDTDTYEIEVLRPGSHYQDYRDYPHTPSLRCSCCSEDHPAYMFKKNSEPQQVWKCNKCESSSRYLA
jgi:hypothetical protein